MGKVCLIFLVCIVSSLPAIGSGFTDTYAFGTRALALGGAFTAVADDYSAAYYNPAGLAQIDGNRINLDYLYTAPKIEVKTLDGQDLILRLSNGNVRNNPTEYPGGKGLDLRIPIIGLMFDINETVNIPVHVEFGLALSMPENNNALYRIASYPPDQPHLIRYGSDIDRIHAALGIGIEMARNIAYIGLGGQIMLYGDGEIYIDDLTIGTQPPDTNVVSQVKLTAPLQFCPSFGLLLTPLDKRLKIGLSYRDKQEAEVDPLSATVTFSGGTVGLAMVMGLNAFYTPREISLGAVYDFGPCMVSAETNLQKWSDYRYSPQDRSYFRGSPDFKDTMNYRLGMEIRVRPDVNLELGYSHVPTPIPNQSGRITNYIDMDKDLFSLGGRYTFSLPVILEKPMTVACVLHYQKLEDYTVHKEGVDDGVTWVEQKSYKVSGKAYAGGVSMGLAW